MKFKKIITYAIFVIGFLSVTSFVAMDTPDSIDNVSDEAIWNGINRRCFLEQVNHSGTSAFVQNLEDLAVGKISELQIPNLVVHDQTGKSRAVAITLYGLSGIATKADLYGEKK